MQISAPCVVSLTWRLEDAHGQLIDDLGDPVEFYVGGDDLFAKVEEVLTGQGVGYQNTLHLEPEHAFGEYHAELVFFEERSIFPDEVTPGMQFEGPPPGSATPDMPADVTALSSEDLGMLYARYVAYTEFLETRAALADITSEEDQAYLAHVDAEVRLRKSGTVADKAAKTLQDPRFVEHEMKALQSKAKARLLRARVKGYERCGAALSREMTRRNPQPE